jgi:hypothetical protein
MDNVIDVNLGGMVVGGSLDPIYLYDFACSVLAARMRIYF